MAMDEAGPDAAPASRDRQFNDPGFETRQAPERRGGAMRHDGIGSPREARGHQRLPPRSGSSADSENVAREPLPPARSQAMQDHALGEAEPCCLTASEDAVLLRCHARESLVEPQLYRFRIACSPHL
jgi:hypothetical protein